MQLLSPTRRISVLLLLVSLLAHLPASGGTALNLRPEDFVHTMHNELAWAGFVLGMTVEQVEETIGSPLELSPTVDDTGLCLGVSAKLQREQFRVHLSFTDEGEGYQLAVIFVYFDEPRELSPIRERIQEQIPDLIFGASRHDPKVNENESSKPLYLLSTNPDQGVLLGPTEGIWVTNVSCLD